MTIKDSAGDQLIASIRKTKSNTAAPVAKKRVAKKRAVKKAEPIQKRAVSSTKTLKPKFPNKQHLVDAFQIGRRVWPD